MFLITFEGKGGFFSLSQASQHFSADLGDYGEVVCNEFRGCGPQVQGSKVQAEGEFPTGSSKLAPSGNESLILA